MARRRRVGSLGLWIAALMIMVGALPGAAQMPPGEEPLPGPLLRVTLAELTVLGERKPEEVREGFKMVLPGLVDCFQGEYERTGRVPARVVLRYNVGSNGKVTWSKVIDPPFKSLEACVGKVLAEMKLAPAGQTVSRMTAILEVRPDHLLAP